MIGGNVGGEVGVRLVGHVGVGGPGAIFARDRRVPDTGVTSVRLGGFEIGGGLHLMF